MDIKSKLSKYLGEEIETMNEQMDDEELLDSMVAFLLDLDEDSLDDDMAGRLGEILAELESAEGDGEEDDMEESVVGEARLLGRTSQAKRREARMYYRKNKAKIKAKLRKLKPKIARLAKMGRGLSGKKLGLTKRRG